MPAKKKRHTEQGFCCINDADIINHAAEQKYEKENVEGKRYRQ
jgi:acetoin utilization deacetylase AcuC-like enzyme